MTWIDFVGYLAALTVLMTFCMDTIVPLRGLAIASNVLFIVYGVAGQLYPVLLLHALLLPINVIKIVRLQVRGINSRRRSVERGRRGIHQQELEQRAPSSPSSRYVERSGPRVDCAANPAKSPENGACVSYSSCSAWLCA